MRKIKINVVMVAILLGTIGAFAFKAPSHKSKISTDLYWFAYDPSGTDIIEPEDEPVQMANNPFGCPNTGTIKCAAGYSEAPQEVDGVWVPQGTASSTVRKP